MKLYLIGLLGSGKSFLGKKVADSLQFPFIDLDDAIEQQEGKKVSTIFSENGEEYFRKLEAEILRKQSEGAQFVMATGGGTPCFHGNMDFINKEGVSVFLDTPVPEIVKRINPIQKKSRPLLANTPDDQLERKLNQLLQERMPFYQQAHFRVNESITEVDIIGLVSKKKNQQ